MDRFSDEWDMGSEDKRDKQMDQRLPTLIFERKWFYFHKWENQEGRKSVWMASFILNMLMILGVDEKLNKKCLLKNNKYRISYRAGDLVPIGLHFREDIEWPLSESSK